MTAEERVQQLEQVASAARALVDYLHPDGPRKPHHLCAPDTHGTAAAEARCFFCQADYQLDTLREQVEETLAAAEQGER